jgi:23S rRNA (guanosine2251-2'-O)-methyltransferase
MRKLSMDELGRMDADDFRNSPKLPLILVLDNIRSLHNVGSIFRSSDAFGIEKIYLCGYTGTPPNPEIRKTALGATETVQWEAFKEISPLLQQLKQAGWTIAAVEQTDQSIPVQSFQTPLEKGLVLILGNEVEGVQEEALRLCDYSLEIPQFGTKHSLNVAVAAGIVLFTLRKQLTV